MDSSQEPAATLILSGFKRLDADDGVLHRGRVTLLAGVPSVGKSALAISMILGACQPEEAAAVYFTSFYENGDLLLRLLASAGGREPARSSQRGHGIGPFVEQAARRGLYLQPQGGLVHPCDEVAEKAREVARQAPGLVALAIDPLPSVSPITRVGTEDRRRNLLGLRELAHELDIAVLLISALPRQLVEADDGRPRLRHLLATGIDPSLVDTALLLHRPALHRARAPRELAEVEVHHGDEEHWRLVTLRYRAEERSCLD
ncbi:MAG: DnaB-like helicase C-terminal domain-containing protein [Pseudomonadota bacterium]